MRWNGSDMRFFINLAKEDYPLGYYIGTCTKEHPYEYTHLALRTISNNNCELKEFYDGDFVYTVIRYKGDNK